MNEISTDLIEPAPRLGSVAHYCLAFTPRERRDASAALYAVCRELAAARESEDPGVARLRLAWWREELQRAAGGSGRHPATGCLHGALGDALGRLGALIDDHEAALLPDDPAASGRDVTPRHAGTLEALLLWGRILGSDDDPWRPAAIELALGLTWRDLIDKAHLRARRGRPPLPAPLLREAHLTAADLAVAAATPAVRDLMSALCQRAGGHLEAALECWPERAGATLLPPLILADLRRRTLALRRASGFDRLDRLEMLTPLRKLWYAWRLSRRAGR